MMDDVSSKVPQLSSFAEHAPRAPAGGSLLIGTADKIRIFVFTPIKLKRCLS